jgi:hypothetical protein
MRAAIALAIIIGWSVSANADNSVGVVVIGAGSNASNLVPVVSAEIKIWLAQRGRIATTALVPPEAVSALVDCFTLGNLDCARRVVDKQAKSSAVVYVQVSEDRGTPDVIVTGYWLAKDRAARIERRGCERCTTESVIATTDAIIAKLVRAATAGSDRRERTSSTPDARSSEDSDPRDRSFARRALPFTAMGVGAAAIIAGSVMIAIDQDETSRAPTRVYSSLPAGVAVTLSGVAVAGLGAYLWFRRPVASSSPVAAITADSAYLGWFARF